jgi:hypothetical protein
MNNQTPPPGAFQLSPAEKTAVIRTHARFGNVLRTMEKKGAELEHLNPQLEHNQQRPAIPAKDDIVDGDKPHIHSEKRRKTTAKEIVQLIEPTHPGSGVNSPAKPSTKLTPLKALIFSEERHDTLGDEADVNIITQYNTKIPFITGLPSQMGSFPSFYQSWWEHKQQQQQQPPPQPQMQQPPQQPATIETAREKQQHTSHTTKKAAMAASNGPIPTLYGKRGGNIGQLPLYADQQQQQASHGTDDTSLRVPRPLTTPLGTEGMRNYIYLKAGPYIQPYSRYMYSLLDKLDQTYPRAAPQGGATQSSSVKYKITWAYVQDMAFCEPISNAFQPCTAGAGCVLWGLPHPKGTFLPQQWIPPWMYLHWKRTGALPSSCPRYCFACMVNYHNVIRNVVNLDHILPQASSSSSTGASAPKNVAEAEVATTPTAVDKKARIAEIVPNWEYRIDIPGEYNKSAFRMNPSGGGDQSPVPLRELVLSQLRPSTRKIGQQEFRRYVEDSSLQYRDGSQRLGVQLTNPSSHESFRIETLTNERILLSYIFGDMERRLRKHPPPA